MDSTHPTPASAHNEPTQDFHPTYHTPSAGGKGPSVVAPAPPPPPTAPLSLPSFPRFQWKQPWEGHHLLCEELVSPMPLISLAYLLSLQLAQLPPPLSTTTTSTTATLPDLVLSPVAQIYAWYAFLYTILFTLFSHIHSLSLYLPCHSILVGWPGRGRRLQPRGPLPNHRSQNKT